MQQLLGGTAALLIGALLLVVVASLPALPALHGAGAKLRLAACSLPLCLTSFLIWQAFDRGPVLIDAFPYRIMRYALAELRAAQEPNVVVIDGGSYVLNGVDASIISEELARLGYKARVVRLAVSAANHFERHRMQQALVQRLNGPASARQRWIYLAEVQAGYDRIALSQFDSNQDSDRLYHYTTIDNFWWALRALRSPGVEVPLHGDYHWPLLRHTLINAFSVGASSRFVAEDSVPLGGGTVTENRQNPLRFKGLSDQIELAQGPKSAAHMLPWLREVRERRSRRLWRRYLTDFVYFGLPSTSVVQLQHVREFCAATQRPCVAPDATLLGDLNQRKYWRDQGHLRKPGARIYSLWLAQQLAQLGVLSK